MSGPPRVVIRLFSGLPDPEWPLPNDLTDDVLRRIHDLPVQPRLFRPTLVRGKPDDVLGRPRSGYRGFQIFADSESEVPVFIIYGRLVLEPATGEIRTDGTDQWEEALWRTVPEETLKELDNITLAELRAPENETLIEDVEGPFVQLRCDIGPEYSNDEARFNGRSQENNCYNYATTKFNPRRRTLPAVPGQINRTGPFSVNRLQEALLDDRLEFKGMRQPAECPPEGTHWIAALVRRVVTGRLKDCHFLRLDRRGHWTHKDGGDLVADADDTGNTIGDLTRAHFVGFPKLAGFYLVHERFLNRIN